MKLFKKNAFCSPGRVTASDLLVFHILCGTKKKKSITSRIIILREPRLSGSFSIAFNQCLIKLCHSRRGNPPNVCKN